jgi:hypothetical protein
MIASQAEPLSFTDPKLTAAALATGGRLQRVEVAPSGRLTFAITGVPSDFTMRIANDDVTVSARAFINAMETVLSLIAQHQGRRR